MTYEGGVNPGGVIFSYKVGTAGINDTITANFSANNTLLCTGDSVSFTDSSTGNPTRWNWTFEGGTPGFSTAQNPKIVYSQAGTYYAKLVVSNSTNSDSLLKNSYIKVNALPVVNLGNDTTLCLGGSIPHNAGNAGSTFVWNTGDTSQTLTADTTGTYYVRVSNESCVASDTIHITFNPNPVVNLGKDTILLGCEDSLLLNAGNPGSTCIWSNGAAIPSIKVTQGTYSVLVSNADGCSATDTIHVSKIPVPITVNLGLDTAVCDCILLKAGDTGLTFNWWDGSNYPSLLVCKSGSYGVTVSNGFCSASDTIHIIVNTPPDVTLGQDTAIPESLILNVGNTGSKFIWSTGDTTQTIKVSLDSFYSVTVTNQNGCIGTDEIKITIAATPTDTSTTSTEELDYTALLAVYPNPANGTFTIRYQSKTFSSLTLTISDSNGKRIYTDSRKEFSGKYLKTIDLSEQPVSLQKVVLNV